MATRAEPFPTQGLTQDSMPAPALLSAPDEMRLTDVARILRRRKFAILGTMLLVIGLCGLYLWRATPTYTASTTLKVTTYSAEASLRDEPMPLSAQDEMRIATHMALLQAKPVGAMVVQQLGLEDDPEFAPSRDGLLSVANRPGVQTELDAADVEAERMSRVVDNLFAHIAVERVEHSALIEISATTSDPRKSAAISNALANIHSANLLRERRSSTVNEIKSVEGRSADLREQATEGERAAVAQGQRAGMPSATGSASVFSTIGLASQLSDARAQRIAAETRYRELSAVGGAVSGPGSSASPLLADLRAQQVTIEKRLAELSAQFGPGYPEMQSVQAQRAEIAQRLAAETERVRQGAAAEIAALRAREVQLEGELASARASEFRAGSANVGIQDLYRSAATNRELYLAQLTRLQELRSREQAMNPEATVVAKALAPTEPSAPKPVRLLAAGASGGLVLGFILAFALEMFDQRLRTPEYLERLTGLRTLAMIPELSAREAAQSPVALQLDAPSSLFAETLRTLFLDVGGSIGGQSVCVVVTSPLPGEGKTWTAAGVAGAGAILGRSSIIVDLDLRRPAVGAVLHVEPGEIDVVKCLESPGALDPAVIERAIVRDPLLPRLSVLPVAHQPENPGKLVASGGLVDLIRYLRDHYEFIVLNAPPVLAVSDARQLAAMADMTLLVVRWSKTPPAAVVAARRLLGRVAIGAVMNRVDYRRHAAGAYGDRLEFYAGYAGYYDTSGGSRAEKG